jgi:hypothetical protein
VEDGRQFSLDAADTAKIIAHEAGHTFGLGHTLSAGDGSPEDIMRYDHSSQWLFGDASLPLTSENRGGGSTSVVPAWGDRQVGRIRVANLLQTQDSYRILMATLGARPADDYGNVMHSYNSAVASPPEQLTSTSDPSATVTNTRFGTIDRHGDFDVFTYTCQREEKLTIEVSSGAFLGLQSPEILVYSEQLNYVNQFSSVSDGFGTVSITIEPYITQRITFVVGGRDGDTLGTYYLTTTSEPGGIIILHPTTGDPTMATGGDLGMDGMATPGPAVGPSMAPTSPRGTPMPSATTVPPGAGSMMIGPSLMVRETSADGNAMPTLMLRDAVFTNPGRQEMYAERVPGALTLPVARMSPAAADVFRDALAMMGGEDMHSLLRGGAVRRR